MDERKAVAPGARGETVTFEQYLGITWPEEITDRAGDESSDNTSRAGNAFLALSAYSEHMGAVDEPISNLLADLLVDLRHLADALDIDYARANDNALGHWQSDIDPWED